MWFWGIDVHINIKKLPPNVSFSIAYSLNSECVYHHLTVMCCLLILNFPLVLAFSRRGTRCLYPWPSRYRHICLEQLGGLLRISSWRESGCYVWSWSVVPEESHELLWHFFKWATISVCWRVPRAWGSEGQSRRAGQAGIHAGEEEFQFSRH